MVEWYRQLPEWKDCFAKSFESLVSVPANHDWFELTV